MSINIVMSKNWAFVVITLIIFGSCAPSIYGYSNKTDYFESVNVQDETTLKCYALGRYGVEETEITLSFEEAERVYDKLKELQVEMNLNPFSEKTHEAKVEYIDLLAEKNLIHHSLTKNDYLSLLNPRWSKKLNDNNHRFVIPTFNRQDSTSVTIPVCSITSGGAGIVYPIMVFPRPRAMLFWQGTAAYDVAVTGIGSLIMNRGCVAIGGQTGLAVGFYGVGLAYGTPFGAIYAVAGYALVATVTADEIDIYPPNARPVIWDPNPSSGETDVPLSLSELSFKLEDYNGDLMSYTVTTNPNIGSGSRSLVKDGVYTVQVGGLESSTTYTWKVSVTDGEDTLEKTFSFTTVLEAPIISNPFPSDGSYNVQVDISHLSFTLSDPQGDLMDVTVETQPDIGSYSDSNVNQGTFNIPVGGLDYSTDYKWYVNVTDGVHWKREQFMFTTLPKGVIILYPTDDISIKEYKPDTNYDSGYLVVRNRYGSGGNPGWEDDVLIKFDISEISAGTLITSATLKMYYYQYIHNDPSGRTLTLYRVASDWNEGTVTWNTRPTYASEVTSSAIVPSYPGVWMEWDVTNDVQDIFNGQETNYGWQIMDEMYWGAEDAIPATSFYPKEDGINTSYLEIGIAE